MYLVVVVVVAVGQSKEGGFLKKKVNEKGYK